MIGVALMLMCAVTLQVSGQNANETLRQKYDRMEKDADANPTDWQKQYAVAQMLIQKDSELHDQEKANKFYERIYHLVSDINDVVPDSVYNEGCYILMLNAMNKSDIEKTVFYAEELIRHAKLKNDMQNSFYIGANALMAPIMIMLERSAGGLDKLLELRKNIEERNYNGVENTDAMLAFFYDQTYSEYREWVADKLMEVFVLFQVIPVEPGDLIVLTVGIVVALLRVQELVSGQNHGHAPAEEEDRHGVLRQLFPEGKDARVFGFSLGAAVPAAVVIGPVRIVPAVGFIMLSPVGIQVMKGKAVVAGDKVYGSVVASVVRVIDISGAGDPVCGCLPHAVIAL